MFNDTELSQISAGTFVLDFVEARLVQQKDEDPDIYIGAASISQNENKALTLKLLGTLQSVKTMAQQFASAFSLRPGEIVGRDNYYKFIGIDMSGRQWTSDDVSITTRTNVSHGGQVVHAKRLREIKCVGEPVPVNSSKFKLVIPGKYDIPFTESQPDTGEYGPAKCTVSIEDGRSVILKTKRDELVVIITTDEPETDEYKYRVLEAVGIAVGAHLLPQVEMVRSANRYEFLLRSTKSAHAAALRLIPPIPTFGGSSLQSFQSFIQRYLKTFHTPFHQTAGLWFRVLNGFHSSLENQGLVLTTACEGVVNAEFRDESRPSTEFLAQLEEAEPLVKALNIRQRAKDRLVQSVRSGKNSTMANALYALEDCNRIPKPLRKNWQDLRHKLAHAGEQEWGEEQTQNFLNSLYACLELFYRLIMLRIQYDGEVRVFSKKNWPTEPYFHFIA